ncbi:MAG: SDR family NAD(P)-dependent oxidoreductase, partial [Bacteroidales bacterium]|nr:SDR family NAD(P)-dependent oxidoreductase [Bacteroidales bacterium]
MMLLENKNAIITGGARGIGKAIAVKFATEGANIAIIDLKYDDNLVAVEKEISELGVKCKVYAANVANMEAGTTVVNKIAEDFGTIDVLVNNAGITRDKLIMRMNEEDWDAVINV